MKTESGRPSTTDQPKIFNESASDRRLTNGCVHRHSPNPLRTLPESGTIKDSEILPAKNHTRTTIEIEPSAARRGRTLGNFPLMRDNRGMHTGGDAIDRTGTSEGIAEILRRGTLRQPSPFTQRIKDQTHLASRPPWTEFPSE